MDKGCRKRRNDECREDNTGALTSVKKVGLNNKEDMGSGFQVEGRVRAAGPMPQSDTGIVGKVSRALQSKQTLAGEHRNMESERSLLGERNNLTLLVPACHCEAFGFPLRKGRSHSEVLMPRRNLTCVTLEKITSAALLGMGSGEEAGARDL